MVPFRKPSRLFLLLLRTRPSPSLRLHSHACHLSPSSPLPFPPPLPTPPSPRALRSVFALPAPFPRNHLHQARAFSADSSASGSPEQEGNTEDGSAKEESKDEQEEEPADEKTQVLEAALSHVPKLGWSEAAIVAGARDVGLSPAIVGAFARKEAALIEFFMDECLEKLSDEIENREEDLSKMVLRDRIAKLVRLRLEMQVPYMSRWAQALSIQANPTNLPTTFKQRALLMDEIWRAAGDRSSDVDWYTKRGLLAAVYTATELYMLTDYSPGFSATWEFLERRIKDAIDCRKTAQEATHLAATIGAGIGNTIQSFFKR